LVVSLQDWSGEPCGAVPPGAEVQPAPFVAPKVPPVAANFFREDPGARLERESPWSPGGTGAWKMDDDGHTAASIDKDRRRFLAVAARLAALASLTGATGACNGRQGTPPPGDPRAVIDVHAHTFNASDLPAARFIRRVLLSMYAEPGEVVELRRIDDPDAVDALVRLFLAVLGSEGAPTAADEIEVLTGRAAARAEFVGGEAGDGPAIDAVADFLRREPLADALVRDADRALRDAIFEASGTAAEMRDPAARDAAEGAFRS